MSIQSSRMPPQGASPIRRFGFGGFCLLTAFVMFGVQQGCAAVNAEPTWMGGLAWFGMVTLLLVAGIWLWDQTANRHWVIRSLLSVAVVVLMVALCYRPVFRQYAREHEKRSVPAPLPTPPVLQGNVTNKVIVSHPHYSKRTVSDLHIGNDNTVVNTPLPQEMGNGNTIVGATDAHGNTIFNKGGTAIGKDARAGPTSVAIGAGANGGGLTQLPPTQIITAPNGIAIGGGTVTNPVVNNFAAQQRTLLASQQMILYDAIKEACKVDNGLSVGLMWEPFEESSNYAGYFMKTLEAAKCLGYRSPAENRQPGSLKGIILVTLDWDNPEPLAVTVREAFKQSSIDYTLSSGKWINGLGKVLVLIGTHP